MLKKKMGDAAVASKNVFNYIDLLAQCPKFVIFTKANRVQIIHEPTKEQIRKRGKARWEIALITDHLYEADKGLAEALGRMP